MNVIAARAQRQTDATPASERSASEASVRDLALVTSGAMLALLPPTLLAEALDPRGLNGATLWLKPMHFQLSLALHFWTLAYLTRLLSPPWRRSRWLRATMLAASLSTMVETAWLMIQAARGTASHFNTDTPLEHIIYILMGLAAVGIIGGAVTFGCAIARSDGLVRDRQLRRGATLGLIGGGAVTVIVAGTLSAGTSHLVGGPQTDAFGLPFLGWATRGGDLRVAHFFATHAMQVLPLAGYLADRTPLTRAAWLMPALAALYLALVIAVFVQALMGHPFLAL